MSETIRPLPICPTHGHSVVRTWGKSWSLEYCTLCSTPLEMLVELQRFCEREGSVVKKTDAQKISSLLGDDGSVWEAPSGIGLAELCNTAGARMECDGPNGYTRYVFPDGSAIVNTTEAWDIEGSTPYSFASEETSDV